MNAAELLKKIDERTVGIGDALEDFKKWRGDVDERLVSMEDRLQEGNGNRVGLPGSDEGKDKVDGFFSKMILGMATKDWKSIDDGEKVYDILLETKKRALSAGVDSAGGFVVPNEYIADLIELLRAEMVLMRAGARELPNLTGAPVQIPRQNAAATAASTGENATITFTDQTVGQVSLSPKMISAGTKMSRRSAALSNPALEGIVRADLAQILGLRADILGLRGTGSSNEPIGIVNLTGIGSAVAGDPDGGPVDYDLLIDLEGAVEDANALRGNLAYIFSPKVRRKIAKLVDGDNRPLFQVMRDPTKNQPDRTLIGYPWFTTTQLPTNLTKGSGTNLAEIIFGNFAELLIGRWGNLIIEASMDAADSSGSAFADHQIWIKAVMEMDIEARHDESFSLANDVETV